MPKRKKQDIIDALKFIDENEIPEHNTSVKYLLVSEDGKKYPPKYVVAVADHLANCTNISTVGFDAAESKNYPESQGFHHRDKAARKILLSITAESVESTDERFTIDNLSLGDNYKPLEAYFKRANGNIIVRSYSKGEIRPCHALPVRCLRSSLPHYQSRTRKIFLYANITRTATQSEVFMQVLTISRSTAIRIEYLTYGYDNGCQFVIYCWNTFSTIIFVQECLKRFGEPGRSVHSDISRKR